MRKYPLIVILLMLLVELSAFDIYLPEGKLLSINKEQLQQEKMVPFNTVRDKDGSQKEENWQGISLIPWLNSLTNIPWQNLQIESKDNYSLTFHRLELNENNAYLAMLQDGEELSEYNMRLIFTNYRENAWMRNIKCLRLLDYIAVPKPRQIFFWDQSFAKNGIDFSSGSVPIGDLMPKCFFQESGDIVFVDEQFRKLCLNYPRELKSVFLHIDAKENYTLVPDQDSHLKISPETDLSQIIYVQCGQVAYVKENYVQEIRQMAKVLNWDWESDSFYLIKASKEEIKAGEKPKGINADCWLEF
ncbi:MAG: hypothetical protein ABFC98_03905 [Candidatus Cloacimonas sp.]